MINPIGEKLQAEVEPTARIIRPYRMHKEKSHSDIPWFQVKENQNEKMPKYLSN